MYEGHLDVKEFVNKNHTLMGRGKVCTHCIVLTNIKLLCAAVRTLEESLWPAHVEASGPGP